MGIADIIDVDADNTQIRGDDKRSQEKENQDSGIPSSLRQNASREMRYPPSL